jgi:predicted phosphodiesterase
MTHRVNGTLIINPGSAGQPRDPSNGFRSSYAVLETQSGEVTFDVYDDPVHKPNDVNP